MKKNNTTRVVSFLLAVMMVLVMVPVIALSAEPAAQSTEAIEVWDGYVPTDSNSKKASVEDWVVGANLASTTLTYTDWTTVSAHITLVDNTITVKSAGGLAILCVMSNHATTIGETVITDHATRMAFFKGKTVVLEKDIYLNDPTKAEMKNDFMPLFWCGLDPLEARGGANVGGSTFNFDGQGHLIYGWQVNHTITYDKTNYLNNAWGFIGHYPAEQGVVKNLALLNQKIELTAKVMSKASTLDDTTDTIPDVIDTSAAKVGITTVCIGGVIGHTPYTTTYHGTTAYFTVENCIVNSDIHCAISGSGSYNDAGVNGRNFCGGGVIGGGAKGVTYYNASGAAQSARDASARRAVKNVILSSKMVFDGGAVGSVGGVAFDGWNATMLIENILVLSWSQKDLLGNNTPYAPLTAHANNSSGSANFNKSFGGVTTHTIEEGVRENWFSTEAIRPYHSTFRIGVAKSDILNKFEETVVTSFTVGEEPKKSFDSSLWNYNDDEGQLPLPVCFVGISEERIQEYFNPSKLQIATAEDLLEWAANPSAYTSVELIADIDMAGVKWFPIAKWGGTFNGNGYRISNLTADMTKPADTTGLVEGVDYYPQPKKESNNHRENARGGFICLAENGLTIKNVYFENMVVKAPGFRTAVHAGMLIGAPAANGAAFTIDGVVIHGTGNDTSPNANLVMGYFTGFSCSYDTVVTIKNSIFIASDPDVLYQAGFAAANKDKWGTFGRVELSNSYAVGVSDAPVFCSFTASNTDTPRINVNNVYVTGDVNRIATYHSRVNDSDNVPVTYKEKGLASFYEGIESTVTTDDMLGDAMGMPTDVWNVEEGRLPVPKVFTAENASRMGNLMIFGVTSLEISTAEELLAFATAYNNGYHIDASLKNDIVFNNIDNVHAGADINVFPALKDFDTTFDGKGFVIYGLYQEAKVNDMYDTSFGFIANVADGATATVKDLGLVGGLTYMNIDAVIALKETAGAYDFDTSVMMEGALRVGALVGSVGEGATLTATNIYNGNDIMIRGGAYVEVGGFIGHNAGTVALQTVSFNGRVEADLSTNMKVDSSLVSINGGEPVALTQAIIDAWAGGLTPAYNQQGLMLFGPAFGTDTEEAVIEIELGYFEANTRVYVAESLINDGLVGATVGTHTYNDVYFVGEGVTPTDYALFDPATVSIAFNEKFQVIPADVLGKAIAIMLFQEPTDDQDEMTEFGLQTSAKVYNMLLDNGTVELIAAQIKGSVAYLEQQALRLTLVAKELPTTATQTLTYGALVLPMSELEGVFWLEAMMDPDFDYMQYFVEGTNFVSKTEEGAFGEFWKDYADTATQYSIVLDGQVFDPNETYMVIGMILANDTSSASPETYVMAMGAPYTISAKEIAVRAIKEGTVDAATAENYKEIFGLVDAE